jgi:muramoyltetrapeptide carboxypeptidase
MITPPYLKSGDKVAIVATARKVSREEMQPALAMLESWGLEVICGKHLFASQDQFAGSDSERMADMQEALDDASIRAIFCARGGYGTVRIVDGLDFSRFMQNPKWIVGYSDVTVLHSHINRHCDTETIHGPMPLNFPSGGQMDAAMHSLKDALWGQALRYTFAPHPLNREGKVNGCLTGGNLSMLYSLIASPSDFFPEKQLLFIEDLDEYLYHIDRMMMNLLRSGKLSGLSALLVGGMSDMNDNQVPFGRSAKQIIRDAVEAFDYPVAFGISAGHITNNLSLIMGRDLMLETGKRTVIQFREV